MQIGIYKISCGKYFYIGSTNRFNRRKIEHFSNLRHNKHHCSFMQNVFNKYGESNFVFEILEHCEEKDLLKREQFYLDTLKPNLNSTKEAGGRFRAGYKMTKKQRKHLSDKRKSLNLSHTQETKDLIRKTLKQNPAGAKRVEIIFDNGKIKTFKSIQLCADFLKKDRASIYSMNNHKPKNRNFKIKIYE